MTEQPPPGSYVGTKGESPSDQVGLRNKLRAWWKHLPELHRAAISIGLAILIAIGLFFIDHSLAYAVLVCTALSWIRRLPPIPWKLAAPSTFS